MSNYNSTNTKILAEHEQSGGNTRMLLLHTFSDGRLEYIIGSYFTATTEISSCQEYEHTEYSWDWGHYFNDVVEAVDYWKSEVLFGDVELFEIHDHSGELDNGYTLHVSFGNDQWCARMYDGNGNKTTYEISGFATKSLIIETFGKHRPSCHLEHKGYMEKQ